MIIHFIGSAGSGKTTLVHAFLQHCDKLKELNFIKKCSMNSQRFVLCKNMITKNFITRIPTYIYLSFKFSTKNKTLVSRVRFIVYFIYEILAEHCRKSVDERETFIVVDQGLSNSLQDLKLPMPMSLLKKLPLPNVVVHVKTPCQDRIRRRILRSKVVPGKEKIKGNERYKKAKSKAYAAASVLDIHTTKKALIEWSCKKCSPPIDDVELTNIVYQAYEEPKKEVNKWDDEQCWMKPMFEKLGVHWIELIYQDDDSPSDKVSFLAKKLISIRADQGH